MLTTLQVASFIDELASSSAAPGGGSAAALSAALGTGLTSMVCRLTIGKKNYADVQHEMEQTLERSEVLRREALQIVNDDTEAFNSVMKAYGMPKATEDETRRRTEAIQLTTRQATLIPLRLMRLSSEGLSLAAIAAEKGNVNSVSDAGVAALMLESACSGTLLNVEINLRVIGDDSFVEETRSSARRIGDHAADEGRRISAIVQRRLGIA